MDWILIIFGAILIIVGIAGAVLPVLPGLPLSYVGLLMLHFSSKAQFSTAFLLIWAAVVVLIQVLDIYLPLWGTKRFGGSKIGVRGSTIGLILGMFAGPLGIVFGPFVGALVGEMLYNKHFPTAFKAAFGAFMGFIIGTLSKIIAGILMLYYFVAALIAG